MGGGQSVILNWPIDKQVTATDLLNEFILSLENDVESSLLMRFAEVLRSKVMNYAECESLIAYYEALEQNESKTLFNTALDLCATTGQIWLIEDATVDFFAQIKTLNSTVYEELLGYLKEFASEKKVFIRACHLDMVIQSLNLQRTLPNNVVDSLPQDKDYVQEIEALRLLHGPELDQSALANHKLHHAAPHAQEIRERTMRALRSLGYFSSTSCAQRFLEAVTSFMIEFHDHEQVDKGDFATIEEATADRILGWLGTVIDLERNPTIKALLVFMANRIIMLGTTMIYSPIRTLDLSELYILIEKSAVNAGLSVLHNSNEDIIRQLNTVMLLTGVADKNSASLSSAVEHQTQDSKVNTLRLLIRYFKDSLLKIKEFFNTEDFNENGKEKSVAQQAFFMTMIPHMSMSAELAVKDKPALVRQLISFVDKCRTQRWLMDDDLYTAWFQRSFLEESIKDVMDEVFFASIHKEIAFSKSQTEGLVFVASQLHSLGFEDSSIVDPTVPLVDAENLQGFHNYYQSLENTEQIKLVQELLLALIVQPGAVYSYQSDIGYYYFSRMLHFVAINQRLFQPLETDVSDKSSESRTAVPFSPVN